MAYRLFCEGSWNCQGAKRLTVRRERGTRTFSLGHCSASGGAFLTVGRVSFPTMNTKAVLMKKGEEGKPFSWGPSPPQQQTRGITIKESNIINR